MRKKSLWLLVSAVIIAAMLLTACKTETATTTTAATTTAATTTAVTTTTTTAAITTTVNAAAGPTWTPAEIPKYGGTLNVCLTADLTSYDSWSTNPHAFARMIYDPLMSGDIMAPKEKWAAYGYPTKNAVMGVLVKSWEFPDSYTVILHLQEGVRFANSPPLNGREFVADDVIYGLQRAASPQSAVATSQNIKDVLKGLTALDKYTVEMKYDPAWAPDGVMYFLTKSNLWPVAKEVVDKFNGSLGNPIGQVGTGPYMVKDYVPGSSFTSIRNPDYWQTDIRYPEAGYKLPYIDKVVTVVIPDLSTRLAAMRTGKIDRLMAVDPMQALPMMKSDPDICYRQMKAESSTYISPRNDLKPYSDPRVRRALSMGIDRHAIVDQYFQGYATYSNYMVPAHWPEFIPLEEFSEEIQEIFEYHPDQSRALLAEAGYPDGFATNIIVSSSNTQGIEIMQLIKTWWSDIGIDLSISVLDPATHASIRTTKHSFPGLALGGGGISYALGGYGYLYQPKGEYRTYATTEWANAGYNERYMACLNAWGQPQDVKDALFRELVTYTRLMTPYIELPQVNNFHIWQTWLRGHWGQGGITFGTAGDLYKYYWIDKEDTYPAIVMPD